MPRIQALTQQHFLERQEAPSSSLMFSGIAGSSEGVPKMHPLKSSMPSLKAGSLIHGLRLKTSIKAARLPKMGSALKLPRLGG